MRRNGEAVDIVRLVFREDEKRKTSEVMSEGDDSLTVVFGLSEVEVVS